MTSAVALSAGGPWFEDLRRGQVFADAPGVTLTEGLAAAHAAIVGDRLRLALDHDLARRVVGAPVAHPALVWDVAIGQSTVVTQRVRANLFYRGLRFGSLPRLGATLRTTTEVVGLRETSRRPDRPATGLAALRIRTVDDAGAPVLDFLRCAMLPLRAGAAATGRDDDLDALDVPPPRGSVVDGWDLEPWRELLGPAPATGVSEHVPTEGAVVVTSAPELARLTLNVAAVHHDARAGGERLVYGGHTIGLAMGQVARALPRILTVVGWEGCDHLGPVREGDTLETSVAVLAVAQGPSGTSQVSLDVRADAVGPVGDPARPVLAWHLDVLVG